MLLKVKIFVCFLSSLLSLLASLWSLMWLFASASLASDFCNNHFSLFHESFRCRQPYLAVISFAILVITSIILFVIGLRKIKNSNHTSGVSP